MIGYFEAKDDKVFVDEFSGKLEDFLVIEAKAEAKVITKAKAEGSLLGVSRGYSKQPWDLQKAVRNEASQMDGKYPGLRDYLSQNMKRLKSIARKHSVSPDEQSFPRRAVDGPVLSVNIFDLVLENNSYVNIDSQTVHDKMQAVISACNEHERLEFRARFNPLHLFKKSLLFVRRILFILIKGTGFNVGKIVNKVFEYVVKAAILLAIIWIAMNWLEFSKDDIIRMIRKILLE